MMAGAGDPGRLLRFGTVGALVAGLYALGFAALVGLGLATPVANALAYLGAIAVQFIGHRQFTYRSAARLSQSVPRFLVTNGAGLAASAVLTLLLHDRLGLPALATGIVVSGALAAMNWVVFQRWVFRA